MNLIVAIVISILVYIVQQRIYVKLWNRNLDVTIAFEDDYVEAGESSAVVETIRNGKFLPLPVFHVKFSTDRSFRFEDQENVAVTDGYYRNDVFSVMGHQKITRRLTFQTTKRGLYGISGLNMTARDFFMTGNFANSMQSDAWLYVLPGKRKAPVLETCSSFILGELSAKRNMTEDPYMLTGIRDYAYGDTMSRINWKATAKTGDLKVNMYGYTAEQRVKILLNLETNSMIKPEYLQEMSIELASSVADMLLRLKISTAICSNGEDILSGNCEKLEAGASMEHRLSVDKYLARIHKNKGIEVFLRILEQEITHPEKNVTYIVVSPYYKENLLLKLDYMKKQGAGIFMLVPYYDIQDKTGWRSYMHGLEVKLNET